MRPERLPSCANFYVDHEGEHGTVRLSEEIYAEVKRVRESKDVNDKRTKRHVERYFRDYCTEKNPRFNAEQFKKQGDFPDGIGGKVAVYTFKCFQWRLYGIQLHIDGKKCFVALGCDPKKQQDKADAAQLTRCAKLAGELTEYRGLRREKNG